MKLKRRTHANPMRLLIMLAVLWAAGSWLFAAENTSPVRAEPAAQAAAPAESAPTPAEEPAEESDEPGEESGSNDGSSKAAPEQEADNQNEVADAEKESDDKEDSESRKADSTQSERAAGTGASPRRFVPSEQVRADFDVSFPIDI